MAQFAVPDADTATGVGWTVSGFARLDEGAPGDDVTALQASAQPSKFLDKGLTDITDPAVSTGHILRARWRRADVGARTLNGRLELWQGVPGSGTLIATLAIAALPTTLQIDTVTLTGGEADNITDYAAIQLRLYYTYTGGGQASDYEVDFIELETPDAPSGQTINIGTLAEVNTLIPVAADKPIITPVGVLAETDDLVAVAPVKVAPIGTLAEVDALIAVVPVKPIITAVGVLAEVDALIPVAADKPIITPVGVLAETDALVAVAPVKVAPIGTLAEVDALIAVAAVKPIITAIGTLPEINALIPVAVVLGGGQTIAVGTLAEVDALIPISPVKVAAIGTLAEVDGLIAVVPVKPIITPIGTLAEVDALVAVAAVKPIIVVIGTLAETDTLIAITLGAASVVDIVALSGAGPLTRMAVERLLERIASEGLL